MPGLDHHGKLVAMVDLKKRGTEGKHPQTSDPIHREKLVAPRIFFFFHTR